MLNVRQLTKAKNGQPMAIGLRDATTAEIDAIKHQLRSHGIRFQHRIEGLKYNGVININTKVK